MRKTGYSEEYAVNLSYPIMDDRTKKNIRNYTNLKRELTRIAEKNKGKDIQIHLSEKGIRNKIGNLEFKALFPSFSRIDDFIHSIRLVCPYFNGKINIKKG